MAKDRRVKITTIRAPVTIAAAATADGESPSGPPTFDAVAYSGGIVSGATATPKLEHDYIIDLAGMKPWRNVAANLDHKPSQRVGHATAVANDKKELRVSGVLSAFTTFQQEVANSAAAGYPWEVSIEGDLSKIVMLAAGKTATVNGREVTGPLYIVRQSRFTGLGFVSNGADEGNSVTIAATAAGDQPMNEFDKFIVSCGADPEAITDEHRATLRRAFDAVQSGAGAKPAAGPSFAEAAASVRREHERKETIRKMGLSAMKDYPLYNDQIERLTTAALESETNPKDFELELLRGVRVQAGMFSFASGSAQRAETNPELIEAAICLSAGLPKIEKHFSEETLHAVDRAGMRSFGLQQLLLRVAHANGYTCRAGDRITMGNLRTVLEYCFPPATARLSGWSTIALPDILGNVANKEILAGYMEEDQTWREVATVKSASNFHTITSYRMLDDLEYEEVGPAGELKHGELGQESYTRQAKTYGKMLALTRADIINDDLGAFDDIRMRLGMGAAKKFNNIFWARFINNSSFFTTARTNYIEGSTTNLGADAVGLQQGITAYRQMRSPSADGSKRIGVSAGRPTILLVPPQLEFIARSLYTSTNLITGASATIPGSNIHAGLFRPVVQDRLSDSAFTGYSTTAWYLFGETLKPMVVSLLNGNAMPTVESSDADFNHLGIQFRAYHDFGADFAEYLSGVKSKGAT